MPLDIKLPHATSLGHCNTMQGWRGLLAVGLLATVQLTEAYKLDLGSRGERDTIPEQGGSFECARLSLPTKHFADSMTTVARSMVDDMMSFYSGHHLGGTPGLLPKPYYCRSEVRDP